MLVNKPISPTAELTTYSYNYPHKSSYKTFTTPLDILDIWQTENRSNLALYLHIPFCEMRCGFCNLFTFAQPAEKLVDHYLKTLERQMRVTKDKLPDLKFSRCAIGGGTPTYLSAGELDHVLKLLKNFADCTLRELPTSIEVSPATVTHDRLQVLKDHGVHRLSIGIQSFAESQTKLLGRPQAKNAVHESLEMIKSSSFPELNIDLIYGMPEQSMSDWQDSITQALNYHPTEIYLYPLYVRPGTGLAQQQHQPCSINTEFYSMARELLSAAGYVQLSLRNFRRAVYQEKINYSCQRDGMLGLGCGARSYTKNIHYAHKFAVHKSGVKLILQDWINQTNAELGLATHGVRLDLEEQFRRYVVLSILQTSGLSLTACRADFPQYDLLSWPVTQELLALRYLVQQDDLLQLTPWGIMYSDSIGPLYYSAKVKQELSRFVQMKQHELDPVLV